jgi:hypothetical protein
LHRRLVYGDESASAEAYAAYGGLVLRVAVRVTRGTAGAEDVAQQGVVPDPGGLEKDVLQRDKAQAGFSDVLVWCGRISDRCDCPYLVNPLPFAKSRSYSLPSTRVPSCAHFSSCEIPCCGRSAEREPGGNTR